MGGFRHKGDGDRYVLTLPGRVPQGHPSHSRGLLDVNVHTDISRVPLSSAPVDKRTD